MKNIINKQLIVILLVSVCLFNSCKKYLNEGPINTPTDATFWTSERAAKTGLAGAYGLLRNALTNNRAYFVFGDATANEFNLGSDWTLASLKPDRQWNFNYLPYNEQSFDWTPFYQAITQCNLIIGKVPNIPDANFTDDPVATKNQILGEAYFLRAYCYYYLTQVWGQPVIVTQAYTDPINAKPLPRSSDQDGFNQVVSDLKKSSSLLKFGNLNPNNAAVQANKGSALALLAKTYMWQKQYDLASKAADSVIKFGQYALETQKLSNIYAGHSQESIFEMNMLYSPTQNEALPAFDASAGYNHPIFAIFLSIPFVAKEQPGNNWTANLDLVGALYDTTATTKDIRVKSTFYGLQSTNPLMIKYANVIYQNPSQQTSPFVSNNLVLLRLADIYLLKAEADANLGSLGTAITNLNIVKTRAGIDLYDTSATDPTALIYEIMDERGRELYGEGQWYFDLVRSGLLTDGNYDFPIDGYLPNRIAAGGWHWPLDLRLLLPQDPLLTQNAWWAGH